MLKGTISLKGYLLLMDYKSYRVENNHISKYRVMASDMKLEKGDVYYIVNNYAAFQTVQVSLLSLTQCALGHKSLQ